MLVSHSRHSWQATISQREPRAGIVAFCKVVPDLASSNYSGSMAQRNAPNETGGLLEAAARGDVAKISALLESGADLNARDGSNRTPLKLAARVSIPAARLLVQHGAKLDDEVCVWRRRTTLSSTQYLEGIPACMVVEPWALPRRPHSLSRPCALWSSLALGVRPSCISEHRTVPRLTPLFLSL